jgi:hypothetical protein
MYIIDVETLTLDDFIKLIDERTFADGNEFDVLLKSFFDKEYRRIESELKERLHRIESAKRINESINFKKEYESIMDRIDEIILHRQEYFKKYKYKGRYHYGNSKGSSRYNKITDNKGGRTYQQLRLM